MSCNCPIKQLNIFPWMEGSTIILWELEDDYVIEPGANVTIEASRHDTADNTAWTLVGSAAAAVGQVIDLPKRTWGSPEHIYYRATLTPPGCKTDPTPSAMGSIPCAQRPYLAELIRREKLRHTLEESQRGWLLKRKYSGTPCTGCINPDFPEEQVSNNCDICFGTGWQGGYYINPQFYVDMSQYGETKQIGDFRDTKDENLVANIQYLNIPDVRPGDVWVDYQSDHRWLIESVNNLVRFGSYVITARAKVNRLPFDDIVYKIELVR